MTIDWLEHYPRIAEDMDRLHAMPEAKIGYDVLSDAIVWSDEYASDLAGRLEEFECIKILLRYRTSVVMGKPDERFRPHWDRAMEVFPNWAGFAPLRREPSDELRAFYKRRAQRDMRYLERILDCGDSGGDAS